LKRRKLGDKVAEDMLLHEKESTMRKALFVMLALLLTTTVVFAQGQSATGPTPEKPLVLRYAHMNAANSPNGLQADYFAKRIAEETDGAIKVEVYPGSQLGTITEMAEMNEKLIAERNVRILYSFYFGTRNLTANSAVYSPTDLSGMKIRAIPSPIYMAAVEGMGAVAIPVDWAEVPVALSTGVADGQENPVSVLVSNNLYDVQDYLMLTGHIMGSEPVVINESVWQKLSDEHKAVFRSVAEETREWASNYVLDSEDSDLQILADKGMTIIGPEDGLKVDEFRASVAKVVDERFGDKWGDYYEVIRGIE
jgi:TRAP-type C4-dicarboxylate transport system substrate-binding protein